jgi:glycosyltransferase involved in cell wall biosynthesis
MPNPVISIVCATYNASHLLRFAIRSVLESRFVDWEMIIVGDCCTDDTEAVVKSFKDSRIRFFNLDSNSGQQAKPNNVGVGLAQGAYLSFLNQDDMYMPHHLEHMLEFIQRTQTDIVCARYARISEITQSDTKLSIKAINGGGISSSHKFQPQKWHVASSWFMTLDTATQYGPWNLEHETYVTPSQDWLFRAWKHGAKLNYASKLTLLTLPSGERALSYAKSENTEHQIAFDAFVKNSSDLPSLMRALEEGERAHQKSLRNRIRRIYEIFVGNLLTAMGIHPNTLGMILKFGRKGGMVNYWQKKTGSH